MFQMSDWVNAYNNNMIEASFMSWVDSLDPEELTNRMEVLATFFKTIGWTTTTADWTTAATGDTSAADQQ